jgi:hypothetical protein
MHKRMIVLFSSILLVLLMTACSILTPDVDRAVEATLTAIAGREDDEHRATTSTATKSSGEEQSPGMTEPTATEEPTVTAEPTATEEPTIEPTMSAAEDTSWQVYVTKVWVSTDDAREGWKRVYIRLAVENRRDCWRLLRPGYSGNDIRGVVRDSGGYDREFNTQHTDDMAIPPYFRVFVTVWADVPEIYAPLSVWVIVREIEYHFDGFELDLESPVTDLAMPFAPGVVPSTGHVIETDDRRITVLDAKLSNLCNYNMAPSEMGCIFLTLELENISGDDISHGSQCLHRAMIDDRGYHTGLSWYTANEDNGIWDGDRLAPGQSGSGILVTPPLYGFDEIETAWAVIAIRGSGPGGWAYWTLIKARK